MSVESGNALESTVSLLERIRAGDNSARESLGRRFLDPLQRWARGRLPPRARDLADTNDLVQITLHAALERVEDFEYRKDGAFLAYLRRALQNRIRDEIRRADRRPVHVALTEGRAAEEPSPLEMAIGAETLERYEHAMSLLSERHKEAVMLRIELGFTYDEMVGAMNASSANAARMLVSRALVKLAKAMDHG